MKLKSKYKNKFNRNDAHQIVDDLMREHNIKLLRWSSSSCGVAYINEREIKIPKPNNLDRFAVCLHEIAHILIGNKRPRCLEEYLCDQYAINQISWLGWDVDIVVARSNYHLLSRVAMGTNRGLKNVPQEIQYLFPYIDFDKWIGIKMWVGVTGKPFSRNDIQFWDLKFQRYDPRISSWYEPIKLDWECRWATSEWYKKRMMSKTMES